MLDWLLQIDTDLFFFINQTLANPVTDFIMPIITNENFLRIFYGTLILSLLIFGKKRFIWIIVFSIIVVALSDQISSSFLKPLIGRLRPCKELAVHLLVNCGAGKSFPSSHAANLFGQAVFFGLLFRKIRWYFILFAFLVAISRIFVGVHYPLDMLGGIVVGSMCGGAMAFAVIKLKGHNKLTPEPYIDTTKKII
ncbi:MAG: phosphatase PAP2 family protein [Candidatus Zixiibacteriota bacterium]